MNKIFLACMSAATLAVIVAGCSDGPAAPQTSPANVIASGPPSLASFGNSVFEEQFTINPSGTTANVFGLWTLNFPENSVCAVGSSYGPNTWDAPCEVTTTPITVTAKVQISNGRVNVQFSPDLRFAPSSDPKRWVTISTSIYAAWIKSSSFKTPSGGRLLGIIYSPNFGASDKSEELRDATLRTRIDFSTGRLWRRVKHFSGYIGSSGEPCEPSPDYPECVWVDDDQPPGGGGTDER
jgi:hypothetical protein